MSRRLLLLVVAVLVVGAGCSQAHPLAYTTQTPILSAPDGSEAVLAPVPPAGPVTFTGTAFNLHTAGSVPPAASDAAWAGVLETLNRYLEAAVLQPLRSGGPAGDLTPLFTSPAVQRVMAVGPDRVAFIDENLPPVSDLRQEAAVAGLNGLAGPDGVLSVVTADLDLRLIGHVGGARVRVVRTGELVLVPQGGSWRIDAYDIRVTRAVGENTTTTTVRS